MLPHKDVGFLLPLEFGVVGFFRWWGRGGLAVECSPPSFPQAWGGIAGRDTQGTHKPRPSRSPFLYRGLPGRVQRKPLSSGVVQKAPLRDFSWGTVIWSPRLECSRTSPAMKSFGNELFLLFLCCFKEGEAVVGQIWKVIPLLQHQNCALHSSPDDPEKGGHPASPATAPPACRSEQAAWA